MDWTRKASAAGILAIAIGLMPGLASAGGQDRYAPTKIEWLGVLVNSSVRHEFSGTAPYQLEVVSSGPDTLMIYVRYTSNVDREAMNIAIDAARQVIIIHAKSYGWDRWLKIVERVEMVQSEKR